jgi:hypothetical protein
MVMDDVRHDTVKLVHPVNRLVARRMDTRLYKRSLCFTQICSQLRYEFKDTHLACWLPTIQLGKLMCYLNTFTPGPLESFLGQLRTMRLTIIPGGTYVLDPLIHICNKLPNLKLELKDERLSQDISFLLHAGTESPKWWKYYNKHVNRAELRLSYRPIKYCHIPYETLFQGVLTTYIPPEPWE